MTSRFKKTDTAGDFPGGPVVKILNFQCWGHRFDPWSGNCKENALVIANTLFQQHKG